MRRLVSVEMYAVRAIVLVAQWWHLGVMLARSAAATGRPLRVQMDLLREEVARLKAENEILRARLRRLHPRERPRYQPWERLAIVRHAVRNGLSTEALARIFVVAPTTVLRWGRGVCDGLRRLVDTREPMNKLSDLVREIVGHLKWEQPRWGTRRIAGILARFGLKASRSSVQRMLRNRRPRRGAVARTEKIAGNRRPIRPRAPQHVYYADFTKVSAFLGLFRVTIGAVIDGFSRKVVAILAWHGEPTARDARELLRIAIQAGGMPRHLVTDHGTQFTARSFVRYLRQRGIRHRYGAVAHPQSVAVIERFWGTLKREFASPWLAFRTLSGMRADLRSYVRWYNAFRPHGGLGLRTPDEVFGGRPERRRRNPQKHECHGLAVEHLGGHRSLPIYRLRRTA